MIDGEKHVIASTFGFLKEPPVPQTLEARPPRSLNLVTG